MNRYRPSFGVFVIAAVVSLISHPRSTSAQTTVADSVRVSRSIFHFDYVEGSGSTSWRFCGAGTLAMWPSRYSEDLGRFTGYTDYTLRDSEGQGVSVLGGETSGKPEWNISVPAGYIAAIVSVAHGGGHNFSSCPGFMKSATNFVSTQSDWYALLSVPDGTPVASFEYRQLGAVDPPFVSTRSAVQFDGSFENGHSGEVLPTGRQAPSEYAWTFGDGGSSSLAVVNHTYEEPGDYEVSLTITDDDGQTATSTRTVTVTEAIVEFTMQENHDVVAVEDTIEVRVLVRNIGVGVAREVTVPRVISFLARSELALALNPAFGDPLLNSDTLVVDLDPGDSVTVTQRYAVTGYGQAWIQSVLTPVAANVEPYITKVTAEDEAGDEADVTNLCPIGECEITFSVEPPKAALIVNSTGNAPDDDPTDGFCDTGETVSVGGSDVAECTLHAAIQTANNDAAADEITFEIDGAGPHVIAPDASLPALATPVSIDATTQPGYADRPVVVLDGSGAGGDGLVIQGAGSELTGLAIDGFSGNGVIVEATNVSLTRLHIGVTLNAPGNGGHGILARGSFDNLTIGEQGDPETGNTIGNSGGNGISLEGPDNGALGKSAHISINISINFNKIGLLIPPGQIQPAVATNALSGLMLKNLANAFVRANTIGNSMQHGIELMGEHATGNTFEGNDVGGWFVRTGPTVDEVQAMANSLSGVFVHSGASGNSFGLVGGRPNTVVASGRYGLRMRNADRNSVLSSLFGVPADSVESVPGKNGATSLINLGNALGGLCLEDSEGNTIGAPGGGNIISNNGTGLDNAGVILTGIASKLNKISSNKIGTNSLGHLIGNIGSGILVQMGASETQIGGDTEAEGNVIGGNSGNGIYLKGQDLEESLAALAPGEIPGESGGVRPAAAGTAASINISGISNNLIGAMFVGETPAVIPNQLNGICLLNAYQNLLKLNTIAGNGRSGIEVMGPLSTENRFLGNALGALAKWPGLQSLGDIFPAGNGLHGMHFHSKAFKNLISRYNERRKRILANERYGIFFDDSHRNTISDTDIGMVDIVAGPGSGVSSRMPAVSATGSIAAGELAKASRNPALINIGNALGGICVRNSSNTQIGLPGLANLIANNGTDSTHAGIELLGELTKGTMIQSNFIGATMSGMAGAANAGPGVFIDHATETTIGGAGDAGNVIAGNMNGGIKGIFAPLTNIFGNFIGSLDDGVTKLPNDGPAASFTDSDALQVGGNRMFGQLKSVLSLLNTRVAEIHDNLIELEDPEPNTPAISLTGAQAITMSGKAFAGGDGASGTGGKMEIHAHEAVHVLQSSGMKLSGLDVIAPADEADAEAAALKVAESDGVNVGSTDHPNDLVLNGGDGIVYDNATGSVSSSSVESANTAIAVKSSTLEVRSVDVRESMTGINAIINSHLKVSKSLIENMSGTNSGIHMENSTGLITGTTITGDAGDAVWLSGSDPLVNGNSISGNTGFGIRNVDASITVDATGNWWGDPDGPGGEGPGGGDAVSANVDFGGWLDTFSGLQISLEAPDTLSVVPGDVIVLTGSVTNLVQASDDVDVEIADEGGWLTSSANFTLATGTDPEPFSLTLAVPGDASGGTEVTVALTATSQASAQLTGSTAVVLVVEDPLASLAVGAGETGGTTAAGGAAVEITANAASNSASIRLFSLEQNNDRTTADDRVLAPSGEVVRPLAAIPGAVWVVQSDAAGTGKITGSFGSEIGSAAAAGPTDTAVAAGDYAYTVCLEATAHGAHLQDLNRAVVVHRRYRHEPWVAQSTTAIIGGIDRLCAAEQSAFGFYSLAAAVTATPSAPGVVFPANDLTGVASDPTLRWNAAIGGDRFEIEVAADSAFAALLHSTETTSTQVALSGLSTSTSYYWRIRTGGTLGFGPWSPVYRFTTSDTGVHVDEPVAAVPDELGLQQNYPNPFRGQTTITYEIPESGRVRLDVYDIQGRLVRSLIDEDAAAGEHSVVFRTQGIAAGVYFYRLTTRFAGAVRSMVVLR